MLYRKIRVSRPPILFDLRITVGLARLVAAKRIALPPPHLMPRLRDYVESLLVAENLPPKVQYITRYVEGFHDLAALAAAGKPFLFKKKHSVSLFFDICAVQSEMSLDAPDRLLLGYTLSMMGFLLFNPDPEKIAMIGLGGGSMPKYCYHHLPLSSIVVVENDPEVIALRDQFCIPPDDARLQVHCDDGAAFVQRATDRFDVLVVDGFDRDGQPPQLCSKTFYDDCYSALAQDGILVVNLLGDVAETTIYLDRIRQCFDGAVIVVDALDSLNKIVFACKGNLFDAPDQVLVERLRSLEARHSLALHFTAHSILQQRLPNNAAADTARLPAEPG
jgi:spermidine synthase